eukprot:7379898-Prymnesium_polylepis.1
MGWASEQASRTRPQHRAVQTDSSAPAQTGWWRQPCPPPAARPRMGSSARPRQTGLPAAPARRRRRPQT